MIVITADQIDSRSTPDAAAGTLEQLNSDPSLGLLLPADRTAGDEIQMLAASGRDALAIILRLTRSRRWSVGCGIGGVREPLPASVRESSGDAFVAARTAVDRSKKRPTRFALESVPDQSPGSDAEAILDLLLVIRDRRSDEGWELHDLLATGLTQSDAAARLGISPQAASKRARAAELRAEESVLDPLARLIARADTASAREVDNHSREVQS